MKYLDTNHQTYPEWLYKSFRSVQQNYLYESLLLKFNTTSHFILNHNYYSILCNEQSFIYTYNSLKKRFTELF